MLNVGKTTLSYVINVVADEQTTFLWDNVRKIRVKYKMYKSHEVPC